MKACGTLIVAGIAFLFIAIAVAAEMDGLMMSGRKIVMVQHGKPSTPIEHEMIMSDGSTLKPDGTVLRKDGTEIHMQNGEVIMPDGHIMHGGKAALMCR